MARPLRIEYPGAFYHVMNRGQLGGHKHEEIGKTVGLAKPSSVSSAYLLMKGRLAKEKRLVRRVRRIEEALAKSKKRT